MINLYYWLTPNGHKIPMFLQEAGVPCVLHGINIGKGDQFAGVEASSFRGAVGEPGTAALQCQLEAHRFRIFASLRPE